MLALLLLAVTATHAAQHPTKLAPPPKSFTMYSKVSGLWQGNKALYCEPDKAIAQTVTEIKLLREVKTAAFDVRAGEIQIVTRDGAQGAIDVEEYPRHQPGEYCAH